jgi:hypothetical protein
MQYPSSLRNDYRSALWGLLFGILLTTAMTSSVLAKDKLPEISSDGLHLMKDTKVAVAYVKPGATLNQYTKVKILDCFVQFQKNWERNYNLSEVGLQGRVTDKKVAEMKQGLVAEFKKVFTKVLTKGGHEVVDDVGPDVLLLRPAIINLEVTAPDVMTAGIVNTWITSAGQMTLYLELYDSATSTLLARVIDPEAGGSGMAEIADRMTNTTQADRILDRWAELLASHLGEVSQAAAKN